MYLEVIVACLAKSEGKKKAVSKSLLSLWSFPLAMQNLVRVEGWVVEDHGLIRVKKGIMDSNYASSLSSVLSSPF